MTRSPSFSRSSSSTIDDEAPRPGSRRSPLRSSPSGDRWTRSSVRVAPTAPCRPRRTPAPRSTRSTYLARTSASRFTVAPSGPARQGRGLGVRDQGDRRTRRPATSTTVRLTPSTAMQPFGTTYAHASPGRANGEQQRRSPSGRRVTDLPDGVDVPLHDSARRRRPMAASRAPGDAVARLPAPRLVRRNVSGRLQPPTSNHSAPSATTVRQAPLTAMLSPICSPSSTRSAVMRAGSGPAGRRPRQPFRPLRRSP